MKTNEEHASLTSVRGRARPVLKGVRIRASATVPLLEVTAEQKYVNESRKNLEVVYTFPVPPRAVLLGLQFTLGERTLRGVVKAKQEALQTYDEAVGGGDSAVLVECQRDGLYTANLGNLKPGESATIGITYGQLLEAQGNDWRIAIPTVLAPFYGDGEEDGGIDTRAVPTQSLEADYPLEVTLEVPAGTDAPRCISHAARVETGGDTTVATLAADAWLDRDVVFLLAHAEGPAALAGQDRERAVVVATTVLATNQVAEKPVSVRLVLDCSGSMAGDSMDWAAVGCQHVVERLRDGDEFSVTRFGSTHDHLTARMLPASPENREHFSRRLLDVTADLGGTEMEQALKAAATLAGTAERSDVVLLTDGEIWASDALVRWARSTGLRIFIIGVGSAPNQPFLGRLAEETGGTCEFVSPGEDMIEAVKRLVDRLREPRRDALDVAWPVRPDWVLQLPAVAHAGQTVHVIAGFEAAPVGVATVEGTQVALHDRIVVGDALSRVVAYQRVLSGHFPNPAAAAEEYQLVTEWTSLVAVLERADADKATGLPELAKVDHMLAAGWGGSGRVVHEALRAAPAAMMDLCDATSFSRPMFRTRESAWACRSPISGSDDYDIPAFLRAQEDDEPTPPLSPPTPEQVLAMGRKVALERRREEISRWIRAINRRVLVEVLAERSFRPTLHWLGSCIGPAMLERLQSRAEAGMDEATIVAAFVELLVSFAEDLEEAVSGHARQWAQATVSAVDDRGSEYSRVVSEAFDDFLFEGAEHPLRAAAAGASA